MAAGKGFVRVFLYRVTVIIHRFATVHRRHTREGERCTDLYPRVIGKRLLGVFHLLGIIQQAGLPLVMQLQGFERLDHLEAHAPGLQRLIAVDGHTPEHEGHAPVRKIKTERHFRMAFIGPIPDTKPATAGLIVIKQIDVHAFVEVAGSFNGVHVFVFRFQPDVRILAEIHSVSPA